MSAVPVPAAIVAEAAFVNENVRLPKRALQGDDGEHVPPIVSTFGVLKDAAKSASWLAFWTGAPLPPPLSTIQEFAAAQPYRFDPGEALVKKNISPTEQVAGKTFPDFTGRVVS